MTGMLCGSLAMTMLIASWDDWQRGSTLRSGTEFATAIFAVLAGAGYH